MIKKILVLFFLFFVATASAQNYSDKSIIIKFKESKYASSQMGTLSLSEQQIPASIKNLNNANGVKTITGLGTAKRNNNRLKNFTNTMDYASAQKRLAKIDAADKQYGIDQFYTLEFNNSIDVPFVLAQYQSDPHIEYAQPNYIYSLFFTPDDTYFDNNGGNNQDNSLVPVAAAAGWDICTGNSTVILAILDSGISYTHPDLPAGRIMSGYDYYNNDNDPSDDNRYNYNTVTHVTSNAFGHGTQVAGHAAAQTNNGIGIAGIDWNCKIMPLKVTNQIGNAYLSDVAAAINYAKNHGADVINMSFGGTDGEFDYALKAACDAAYAADIILVAAMGNSGDDTIYYPAGYESVIGVGATDETDTRANFSTYGSGSKTTELVAPGSNLLSTCAFQTGDPAYLPTASTDGNYHRNSGTSFSTPIVSGLCTLMKAQHPGLTSQEIRLILHNSADDLGTVGYDKYYGYGRVNIYNALKLVSTYKSASNATLRDIYNFPNPATEGETQFSFKSDKVIKEVIIIIYDLRGREVARLESGVGATTGTYVTDKWDCTNANGSKLANGTYIYVIKATDGNDEESIAKGKLAIVN